MARLGRSFPVRPRWVRPVGGASPSAANASGGVTLGGSTTGTAPAAAAGGVTLGGTSVGAAPAGGAGSVSLGGSVAAQAPAAGQGGSLRALANVGDGATDTAGFSVLSVVIPAAARAGDVALVTIALNGNTTTVATPSGWSLRSGPDTISTAFGSYAFERTLGAGDAGTTVDFVLSQAVRAQLHMDVVAGFTLTGPVFGSTVPLVGQSSTVIPTLAGVPAGAYISVHVPRRVGSSQAPVATVPAPYTTDQRIASAYASSAQISSTIAHEIATSAGTYGGESVTFDVSSSGAIYAWALSAAGGGGAITLGGAASASTGANQASSSGSVTLGGTASAAAPVTSAGLVTLDGAPVARAVATASGTVTLGGTATATSPATAAGSVTLSGTATVRAVAASAGTVTLSGAATGQAPATAAGSITLSGAATATQPGSSSLGAVTLGGTAAATARVTAAGAIILSGAPTARAAATGAGVITIGGAVTARVPATVAGAVALNGIANAAAGVVIPTHTYVTATIVDLSARAALASDGTSAAALLTVAPWESALVPVPPLTAALTNVPAVAVLAGDGTSGAALANSAAQSTLQTTT